MSLRELWAGERALFGVWSGDPGSDPESVNSAAKLFWLEDLPSFEFKRDNFVT